MFSHHPVRKIEVYALSSPFPAVKNQGEDASMKFSFWIPATAA